MHHGRRTEDDAGPCEDGAVEGRVGEERGRAADLPEDVARLRAVDEHNHGAVCSVERGGCLEDEHGVDQVLSVEG